MSLPPPWVWVSVCGLLDVSRPQWLPGRRRLVFTSAKSEAPVGREHSRTASFSFKAKFREKFPPTEKHDKGRETLQQLTGIYTQLYSRGNHGHSGRRLAC